MEVSPELISPVTDVVLAEYQEWPHRPLKSTYAIVSLEALFIRVREASAGCTKAVYLALGGDEFGPKEVFGFWLGEHDGAKFWLSVLKDLKTRGLSDILIAVVDGLKGFPEALSTAFPLTTVQTCIVPLRRHSLSSAAAKERRPLAAALKPIYQAINVEEAEARLEEFAHSELGQRHPDIVRTWRNRWEEVIPFLGFSPWLRKSI